MVVALIGLFGLLALVITAAGIAGVIAFSVNQRTQEFGIRMALGARRGRVLALVIREGLVLVTIGLAIGMSGALVLTRLMGAVIFDPPTATALAGPAGLQPLTLLVNGTQADRRRDLRGRRADADRRGAHRLPDARPPRGVGRSHGRASRAVSRA